VQGENGQIVVRFEGNVIQTIPLTRNTITIGRAPEVGISLPHPLISRAHAQVRQDAQGLVLTDLGSSNGTFIGEERLAPNQPRILTDRMTFRIGPYQLIYQAAQAQQLPSAWVEEPDEQREPGTTQPEPPATEREAPTSPVPALISSRVPQAISPLPRPRAQITQSAYSRFLPGIYQENDFLQRFLSIFEDIWEPLEQRQDYMHMYFDPRTCPAPFLPWLASWLGLTFNPHWPEARRRRLLAQAMDLYRWRGTRYGLIRVIEVCTGLTPVIIENPLEPFVFRIRITGTSENPVDKELIEELISTHKPAHAGYMLEVNA
jgi:phage tail-like protein